MKKIPPLLSEMGFTQKSLRELLEILGVTSRKPEQKQSTRSAKRERRLPEAR